MIMTPSSPALIGDILSRHSDEILSEWLVLLRNRSNHRVSARALEAQCAGLLQRLAEAASRASTTSLEDEAFGPILDMIADISRSRAAQGFSPSETAAFLFSLKEPLFARIAATGADRFADDIRTVSSLLDAFALRMMDTFQREREDVILRQQSEITELSTPVVKLWQGVLALPLIGTLDSSRTQVVMENLLDSIVRYEADIAIIDITGVPTVDTLVAQHLLKTVAAARLMGADCIISGIRPQIAQTMVHLGVELNVVSKATLADAFALALRRLGRAVVTTRQPALSAAPHAG
jgi:rsbT co-antagonist protein RsbR